MRGLEDTSNRTFRDVVGNGVRLEVPRFQRDYSWSREQWQDLWEDIDAAQRHGDWHYLGFVVLQRRGTGDEFVVVDGQQRLTTLSLFVLAAMAEILKRGGQQASERADALRRSYIGRQDPVTLTTENKLTLNRNNRAFYKRYLAEMGPIPTRGLSASERLLKSASEFFGERFRGSESPAAIAERVEFVASRFFFTVIYVNDQLNAYRVFETLNARGVKLSAADLLKNYLFAVVDGEERHANEINDLEERWVEINEQLGRESFQDFLRAFWNSRYKKVRAPQLYRAVKDTIRDGGAVFRLLRDLAVAAPQYVALRDPGHEYWRQRRDAAEALDELRTLRVRQYLPLLLSGVQELDDATFVRLVRDVVAFSLRYNVIAGRSSGDQETLYNDAALLIRADSAYHSEYLARGLPSDDEFRASFRQWRASSSSQGRKLARYVLAALERQASGQQVLAGAAKITLEHVLPQSAAAGWPSEEDPVWDRSVWRLGNLALLEEVQNRSIGNERISSKLEAYGSSSFELTRGISEYVIEGQWTEQSIDRRQIGLAKLATSVWKLS